jgi:ABC-type phosphate transport system substrate-binding protein
MRTLLIIIGLLLAPACHSEELLVIASPQVPDNSISLKKLADIYLVKKMLWSDGTSISPVNREASSPQRERFFEIVFNIPPEEFAEYIDRLRFQGKLPPVVQTSNKAVLEFVRSVPGAIGYVDGSLSTAGVKVLAHIQ